MNMKFNSSYVAPRKDIAKYIQGKNLQILDIGCSDGTNGVYLKELGIASHVTGIEYDNDMGLVASSNLDSVFIGSIEDPLIIENLSDEFFDYILFGDVLEHLDNPWNVLAALRAKLKPTGRIIVSIPNTGHIDVAYHLLIKKKWPINERGIFDKTHKRFFALNNLHDLIEGSGYTTMAINRNFRFRDAMFSEFPFYGKVLKKIFPDWFTHQFIIIASK
ncbi:class I SAM-dependent methyltransferase [Flavihumibacter sp.]|uniref:class I SAM-dependent methyltransferase n=1 Tax=Flavihumibacter sp. TaxID=1913981 RepID=UPI002FC5D58C